MQSLDNTHERHQISTTGATSAVQPIGTNGLKKAENHNHNKMHLVHNQALPNVAKLVANIRMLQWHFSLIFQTKPQLLSVFVLSLKTQVKLKIRKTFVLMWCYLNKQTQKLKTYSAFLKSNEYVPR